MVVTSAAPLASAALTTTVLLVFAQMLPATLVAPAIRPLFAKYHAGAEGAAHAFMAVNMLGAIVAGPLLGADADRRRDPRHLLPILALCDAILLGVLALPIPTGAMLALRLLEGAAHVGGMTLLLSEASGQRTTRGASAMGWAGGALMLAVACGSALGSLLVAFDPRAPFWAGAAIAAAVGLAALVAPAPEVAAKPAPRLGWRGVVEVARAIPVPVATAFVGRFAVGCLVVSFALFGHRAHALSDRHVGALFTIFTFTFALGMVPAELVARTVGRAVVLATGLALEAAAFLSFGWLPPEALPAAMCVGGLAAAGVFATTLAYGAAHSAGGRATAMGAIGASGSLGMLLGPAAAGVACAVLRTPEAPLRGYRVAFGLGAAAHVALLVVASRWLMARAREERCASGADRA